ncbi:YwdI family protein [Metabacillus sp. KIGAM252]|uniref:YwdI family protein n=1 Tax=Metabacillus flavus TaxID=2823519 RepID=A0ABS5LJL1_9BACI|nr:YwdI family protein [Metabacillus flavus]MBS2970918.1 YwdI family protein [Metabacillus flavus]
MDISIHQLLNKMETELREARISDSDQAIREKLLVIKSLCDVVLDQEPARYPEKPKTVSESGVSEYELQKMMGISKPPSQKSLGTGERLKDEGANGSSLFDF